MLAMAQLLSTLAVVVQSTPSAQTLPSGRQIPRFCPFQVRGGSSYYDPNGSGIFDPVPTQQQTEEERLAAWRQYQHEKQMHQTAEQQVSYKEEDGRLKLLASVSRGSISFFFFVLMWRCVHHFELADQFFTGALRFLAVTPLVALFIANMAGVVGSITSPSHSAKKRLKLILNLNKLVELALLLYNICRLIVAPSKHTPQEVYVARTVSNFFFLIQCQLFTKLTWDAAQPRTGMDGSEYPPSPYGLSEYAPMDASQQPYGGWDPYQQQQQATYEALPGAGEQTFANGGPTQ